MAITRIGSNYNVYESTYIAQKNEAAKKAETKETATQTGVTANIENEKVSDYYSYLQKNYDCMSKGNVSISSQYLKQCAGDNAKAKELEDFLKKIPELEKQGYEELAARNKALGGTVTYYQQTSLIGLRILYLSFFLRDSPICSEKVISISSENLLIRWKHFDNEVPPLKTISGLLFANSFKIMVT